MKLTLNAKECAELMGVSYSTFAVHWREWVKAKRFPEFKSTTYRLHA